MAMISVDSAEQSDSQSQTDDDIIMISVCTLLSTILSSAKTLKVT